ncbi:predicted protein [Nematostella vectensis]|uniref:Caspase-3 n=2 Tax=Nematostella vectensis TaxID=45351 RepID=A7S364_NEMVE|nr:predicted protein [Nematostella vectensis]|eukprot:XP_001633895.1 predicted protein [Nematostella vectensis]
MDPAHRRTLRTHRLDLIKDLEADKVASTLYGVGILDETDLEDIKAAKPSQEKAEILLDKLPKRGPDAFSKFCDALEDISPHLASYLRPSQTKDSGKLSGDVEDGAAQGPIESVDGGNAEGGGLTVDGGLNIFGSSSKSSSPSGDLHIYKMDKTPRGVAVIINNKDFLPASGMHRYPRNGTNVDRDSLEKTFKALQFDVEVHNNKTTYETNRIIKELGQRSYSNYNAMIFAILTHGEEGILYTTDGTIEIRSMMKAFKGDNLVGKPKIFIFQACQGHEYMDGKDATDAGPEDANRVQVPVEADFLYAYSTVPGYYSWRNSVNGSWFIQSICEVFNKHMHNMDVLRMMTRVNSLVSTYQSRTGDYYSDRKKQVPSIVSMLRKDLFFFPENVTQN